MNTTHGTHPWHDIEVGSKQPEVVNMIVEIPKGSKVKYELDKKTGMLMLDRHMHSAVYYPGDYGFIPKTLWEDNDPLDIFVMTSEPTFPMTLCEVKPIGVMRMVDSDEGDDKVIAVHANDPRYNEINDIADLPKHIMTELKHFLETYKQLQKKEVKVLEILGREDAHAALKKGMDLYNQKFNSNE